MGERSRETRSPGGWYRASNRDLGKAVSEEGQAWLKGRRQVPWGFGWLEDGQSPYGELPLQVQRIAYREFSRNPDLPYAQFEQTLGRELLGPDFERQSVEDLADTPGDFRHGTNLVPAVTPDLS